MNEDNKMNQNTDPAAAGEKTFTQEDVNRIVQERLARTKTEPGEKEKEYDQKLQELQSRELKILVKEQLSERNMPAELADIITCTDKDDLGAKLDALQKIYGNQTDKSQKAERSPGFRPLQVGATSDSPQGFHSGGGDPYRKAMGLK